MTSINLSAASAAKQILGFYDTIPATDQRAFTAGFVEMLSMYPQPVLERATSPSRGLAAYVAYANLARFKEKLDEWHGEYLDDLKRRGIGRANRLDDTQRRLPPPDVIEPNIPGRLAQVFVPEGHERYASFVEWSKTAETKWWKFGRSSDNRAGIWIPYGEWDRRPAGMRKIGDIAKDVVKAVKPEDLQRLTKISDEWREASTPMDREFAE